jgi:hypothetical protein
MAWKRHSTCDGPVGIEYGETSNGWRGKKKRTINVEILGDIMGICKQDMP